jgi:hypothetical protein
MKKKLWYNPPMSLSLSDWKTWRDNTKAQYPIQYWFRETLTYWGAIQIKLPCRELYWKIYRFFNPCHKDIRKAIPRHKDIRKAIPRQWSDIASLIVDVNFAMILSFHEEADESFVDWDGTPEHRQFKNWLDSAVHWIKEGRPNCEAQKDALHPPYPLPPELEGKSYTELYSELNKIEQLIVETDSNILKQMIDYRDYMWT